MLLEQVTRKKFSFGSKVQFNSNKFSKNMTDPTGPQYTGV
jgi:hypothetical protein